MKAYKKIATIVPVAVLSTSVLFSPVMTFAAEKMPTSTSVVKTLNTSVSSQFSKTDFENWLNTYVQPCLDGFYANPIEKSIYKLEPLTYSYAGSSSMELIGTAIGDGKPQDVVSESLENPGPGNQILLTPSKAMTTTNSFTVSNSEGAKLTIGAHNEFNIGIPGLGGAKGGFSITAEGNYQHTTADTLSKTETVTFPSQQIVAAPGTKTTLQVVTYEQEFKGTDTNSIVEVDGAFQDQRGEKVNIYSAIKNAIILGENVTLPSYVKLDDKNGKVFIQGMSTNFSGVNGYHTEGKVIVEDLVSKKKTEMPLNQYKLLNK